MYLNKICHIYKYYICLLYEEISHNDHSIYYELQLCTLILYSVCVCMHTHTHKVCKYFIFKHKTAIHFLDSYLQLLSEGKSFLKLKPNAVIRITKM